MQTVSTVVEVKPRSMDLSAFYVIYTTVFTSPSNDILSHTTKRTAMLRPKQISIDIRYTNRVNGAHVAIIALYSSKDPIEEITVDIISNFIRA